MKLRKLETFEMNGCGAGWCEVPGEGSFDHSGSGDIPWCLRPPWELGNGYGMPGRAGFGYGVIPGSGGTTCCSESAFNLEP